jgi:hypothetical protein
MGWVMSPRRGGYGRIRARPFPALLVVVDEVVEAEHDDLLRVFGHDKIQKVETATWVREHLVDAGDVPMQSSRATTKCCTSCWRRCRSRSVFRG